MYFGRGFAKNEIGDCNLIAHEGRLHLFHVCLPSHDVVAHLVSDDGINWEALPYALRVGDPGAFDDDQIWTMSTFRWEGRFYLLYTALSQADDGLIQRSGLAISDDLIHWGKVAHNPIATPDARWYEADTSGCGRADWRDPFGWVEGDTIHALVSAHEKDGPQNRRGCIGHFVSHDALNWEVRPPFYAPGLSSDREVPAVMKLDNSYYLMGHTCVPSQDTYRVAESIDGPWRRPASDWILPRGSHIFCPVEWQGKTLLFHWIEAPFDWPDRRRFTGPSNVSRAIAPPKEAIALPDGQLMLRSCTEIWGKLTTSSQSIALESATHNTYRSDWQMEDSTLNGHSQTGMGIALLPGDHADFVLDATITIGDACEAGIFWRSDEDANASTSVSLIPSRGRVELQRTVPDTPGEPGRLGRGFLALQENVCQITPGTPIHLRIVVWGPYIEISVDDRVLLYYITMSRRSGNIGFFVNDGSASFSGVEVGKLAPPPMPEAKLGVGA